MRLRSLATATALAVAVVPFLTSSALSADSTVGETFDTVSNAECGGLTWIQVDSPGNAYRVPADGIVTSYSISPNTRTPLARTVAFKTARVTTGATEGSIGSAAITGSGPEQSSTGDDTPTTGTVRIPVRAGDLIGAYYSNGSCGRDSEASYSFIGVSGNAAVGLVDSANLLTDNDGTPLTGFQFGVRATVEADADGDGFGDTTQDKCATDATTQGACPVVKDAVAPQTTVVSATAAKATIKAAKPGKKAKLKKARVTVAFAATETSTYTCSIDGGAYAACTSPFTAKLKKGTHTIAVRATDAAGNTDTTPATTSVKVKKAKTKRKP